MRKSIIDEYIDEIKELYNSDILIKDIAADFNIRPTTLGSYIRSNPDIFNNPHRRYRRLTDEESKEIYLEWLESNKSIIDIAKERNVSEGTVRRHISINLHKRKVEQS